MKRAALTASLCLLPYLAAAEPVSVRSGEHAAYSRLVALVRDQEWSIRQEGRAVFFQTPDNTEGFDTGTVFDRIPRTRIASIDSSADEMRLTLNCDCVVSAFVDREAYVVIDVANEVAALVSAPVAQASTDSPIPPAPELATVRPRVAQGRAPTRLPASAVPDPQDLLSLSSVLAEDALTPAAEQVLRDVEERLQRELQIAARRGVLEASDQDPAASDPPAPGDTPNRIAAQNPEDAPETAQDRPLANLRISTSRDLPDTLRAFTEAVSDQGFVCPPSATLDVAAWGDDGDFATQINSARADLYNEVDRLNPKAALRLARSYLFFGFGAEARSILQLDLALAARHPELMTLSQIVDGIHPGPGNALSELGECQGPTALWAMLALPDPPEGVLPDSTQALKYMTMLPQHLRQALAPQLSQVLLAYGDPDGAATALRSLERLPVPLKPDAELALAKVELQDGRVEEGANRLEDLATNSNSPQSPEALVAWMDSKLAREKPIEPEVADLVAAYATELRDTPLGPDLRRAHVIALLKSGQFDAAFQRAAELGGNENNDAARDLRRQMMVELTSSASDIVFLDLAYGMPSARLEGFGPAELTPLAARFHGLGFNDEAERVMTLIEARDMRTRQRLLSAKIAMAQEKPFLAQSVLLGEDSEEAQALMSQARAMVQQPVAPSDALTLLPDDLQAIAELPDPADVAEAAQTGEGMLARSAALLENSSATRASIAALLEAASVTPEASN